MFVVPATESALTAINEYFKRFDETAARLARNAPGEGLAEDLVGLSVARNGVQASAAVVQATDEMTGTLLDTFA